MLNASTEFHDAADANTTEADCKVEIYREFNAIARDVEATGTHGPIDPRFGPENVLNVRNPLRNGIAYGPIDELFASHDPARSFRVITSPGFDTDRKMAYYIPKDYSGSGLAVMLVDYKQPYKMNAINVRYENSRTTNTFYDDTIQILVASGGGTPSLVWSGTMNNSGSTTVYFNGTDWDTGKSRLTDALEDVQKIQVKFLKNSYEHNPRVMYIGGLEIVDVSDDIIDVSVKKTEFEPSSYLPTGEPSANSCNISLDNTDMKYRFGSDIDVDYFLRNQRIVVQFGLNTKYGGGADEFEYVPAGTFYVDDYGYDEEDMTVSISGTDYAKFLQERHCKNKLWVNKSLKYIIHDVLAMAGFALKGVQFDFGVARNANETNKRKYTWATDEQTVWDFLTNLIGSELGTMFFDENNNLIFTDRLDMDQKVLEGSQYLFDADTNLVSLEERFEVGANKVKVQYEKLSANTTKNNPQLVRDKKGDPKYQSGPEIMLNQALWQPEGDEAYLGSATLAHTLRPGHQYIRLTRDSEVQITRDEGEVLIGDEFIQYRNRQTMGDGTGRLTIVKRDARGTVFGGLPVYKGVNSGYGLRLSHKYNHNYGGSWKRRSMDVTNDGFHQWLHVKHKKYAQALYLTEFERSKVGYNSNYRIYSARFRFNKVKYGYQNQQAAGLYVNMNSIGRGIFFEINNPKSRDAVLHGRGNVRAYKTSDYYENRVPMPPDKTHSKENFLFEEKTSGPEGNAGTFIEMTVIQEERVGPDQLFWYINGEFVGQFRTEYKKGYLSSLGYNSNQQTVGNDICQKGRFGFFTRGGTNVTLDYIYASNDDSLGPDEILHSRGFTKYFDSHTNTWQVRRDYNKNLDYYIEFGAPVHEVVQYEADHDTFPNLTSRVLNTDEESVTVFNSMHSPFDSKLLVGNTARIGVNLNDTIYYPNGTAVDHNFLVYGVTVIRSEADTIHTTDKVSVRRYGESEVEIKNPWVNSKKHAISLAKHLRKFWSEPQQFFDVDVMPNPALQVRDRVNVTYTEKGFDTSAVWFVNGIEITYDGGLESKVLLKRYEDYPTGDFDYRE